MATAFRMPETVRRLELLPRVDYQDCHLALTTCRHSPEQWATLILHSAPRPMMELAWAVQRFLLGLDLQRPTPDRPMGSWNRVAVADAVVLSADGRDANVRLVGFTTAGGVGLATLMSFNGARIRLTWTGIAPLHRGFARNFLDRAVEKA